MQKYSSNWGIQTFISHLTDLATLCIGAVNKFTLWKSIQLLQKYSSNWGMVLKFIHFRLLRMKKKIALGLRILNWIGVRTNNFACIWKIERGEKSINILFWLLYYVEKSEKNLENALIKFSWLIMCSSHTFTKTC